MGTWASPLNADANATGFPHDAHLLIFITLLPSLYKTGVIDDFWHFLQKNSKNRLVWYVLLFCLCFLLFQRGEEVQAELFYTLLYELARSEAIIFLIRLFHIVFVLFVPYATG